MKIIDCFLIQHLEENMEAVIKGPVYILTLGPPLEKVLMKSTSVLCWDSVNY